MMSQLWRRHQDGCELQPFEILSFWYPTEWPTVRIITCNIRHCRKFAHRINKGEILGNTGTKLVSLSFLQDGVGGKIRNFLDFLQSKYFGLSFILFLYYLSHHIYVTLYILLYFVKGDRPGGARVAQWWEHSPPTNVTRVRILHGVDAICGLSLLLVLSFCPLLRQVFLRVLRFFPLLKNQHFQIPIRSGTHGHVSTSSYELLSDSWVNKLQFTKITIYYTAH